MITDTLSHGKALLKACRMEIIKEDTANTACLFAMFEIKVLIAPLLEAWMQLGAKWVQRVAASLVKMLRIFFEAIVGRQIHAATEPPDTLIAFARRGEEAHVHVHGRRIRITRMKNQ